VTDGSSLTLTEGFSVSFPFPLSFLGLPLPLETIAGGQCSSKAGAEVARETEGSSESGFIPKGSESGMAGGYLRNHGIRGRDDTAVHVVSRRTLSPSVRSAFRRICGGRRGRV
jgi:hypothetical protein